MAGGEYTNDDWATAKSHISAPQGVGRMSPLGLEMEEEPTDHDAFRSNGRPGSRTEGVINGGDNGNADHPPYANGNGHAAHNEDGRFGGSQDDDEEDEAIGLLVGDSGKLRSAAKHGLLFARFA